MSDKKIRIGVVGGWGHQTLLAAATADRNVEIVAIASDGNDDAVKKYIERKLVPQVPYFDSYERMMDELKPDVISLGARFATNAPIILAALARGMDVVTDKPIADSYERLEMIKKALAKDPKRKVLTEFMMRMEPAFAAMKRVVRAGDIGDVCLIQAQKSYHFGPRPDWYNSRKYYPGTIMFIGCHVIDLSWWVTGLKYTSVVAASGNIAMPERGEFDDHAGMLFKLENKGTAVMHADFLRPRGAGSHGDDRLRIAGSKGVVEVRDNRCVLMAGEKAPVVVCEGPYDRVAGGSELLDTLRGGGTSGYSNTDTLYLADVILKVREAADTGMTMVLK